MYISLLLTINNFSHVSLYSFVLNLFRILLIVVDNCPQRYLDGSDPFASESKIYVLGAASHIHSAILCSVLFATFTLLFTSL